MISLMERKRETKTFKFVSAFVAFTFLLTGIAPSSVRAQSLSAGPNVPMPAGLLAPTPGFTPVLVKALEIDPKNPLHFGFIVDNGTSRVKGEALTQEAEKLIRYFLASLTTPEQDMWVNLSPYEKDRIIPQGFGDTVMGRDLLAQDYILKQLTASLIYPEDELGKKFWSKVYKAAYEKFGTTDVPVDTFNKIWIVPKTAAVYEKGNRVFVVESSLEVMMESDYLAMAQAHKTPDTSNPKKSTNATNSIASSIIKEIIIPEIEKEVNFGKNFANLRQVYNAMILAAWYKNALKESLLGQVYVDKNKTKGVDIADKEANQKIYDQYLEAFKKGVYNYIKVEKDSFSGKNLPRKYFSGGFSPRSSDGVPLGDMVRKNSSSVKITTIQKNIRTGNQNRFDISLIENLKGADTGIAASAVTTTEAESSIVTRGEPDDAVFGPNIKQDSYTKRALDKIMAQMSDMAKQMGEAFFKKSEWAASEKNNKFAKIGFDAKNNRMGWTLMGLLEAQNHLDEVIEEAQQIREDYKYVVFSGMGGSGLSVQLAIDTFGQPKGMKIISLRTTDPDVIRSIIDDEIVAAEGGHIEEALKKTKIIVVSKSGTTQETKSHQDIFEKLYQDQGVDSKGHFTLVTDPGSPMEQESKEKAYDLSYIQLNNSTDIGGRFTSPATRVFLLPMALINPDLTKEILKNAGEITGMKYYKDPESDPYLQLATWLFYQASQAKRDKVTFIVPKELKSLPMWAEQLIEESLGKDGKGISIFYEEDLSLENLKPIGYNDRVFVRLRNTKDNSAVIEEPQKEFVDALKAQGYPVFDLYVGGKERIGELMYGLQRTVAAIGWLWDITFVNQPGVDGYKKATNVNLKAMKDAGLSEVKVPANWKAAKFENLNVYYTPFVEAGIATENELALEVEKLGGTMDDAAAVYAAMMKIALKKGNFEAAELASYGRMTSGFRKVLETARTEIMTRLLKMPAKIAEGPDKNHSFQQNIAQGKDMWFSTYFLPEKTRQSKYIEYDVNPLRAQAIGTVQSLVEIKNEKGAKAGRKAVLITIDGTVKDGEKSTEAFFAKVGDYLAKSTGSSNISAEAKEFLDAYQKEIGAVRELLPGAIFVPAFSARAVDTTIPGTENRAMALDSKISPNKGTTVDIPAARPQDIEQFPGLKLRMFYVPVVIEKADTSDDIRAIMDANKDGKTMSAAFIDYFKKKLEGKLTFESNTSVRTHTKGDVLARGAKIEFFAGDVSAIKSEDGRLFVWLPFLIDRNDEAVDVLNDLFGQEVNAKKDAYDAKNRQALEKKEASWYQGLSEQLAQGDDAIKIFSNNSQRFFAEFLKGNYARTGLLTEILSRLNPEGLINPQKYEIVYDEKTGRFRSNKDIKDESGKVKVAYYDKNLTAFLSEVNRIDHILRNLNQTLMPTFNEKTKVGIPVKDDKLIDAAISFYYRLYNHLLLLGNSYMEYEPLRIKVGMFAAKLNQAIREYWSVELNGKDAPTMIKDLQAVQVPLNDNEQKKISDLLSAYKEEGYLWASNVAQLAEVLDEASFVKAFRHVRLDQPREVLPSQKPNPVFKGGAGRITSLVFMSRLASDIELKGKDPEYVGKYALQTRALKTESGTDSEKFTAAVGLVKKMITDPVVKSAKDLTVGGVHISDLFAKGVISLKPQAKKASAELDFIVDIPIEVVYPVDVLKDGQVIGTVYVTETVEFKEKMKQADIQGLAMQKLQAADFVPAGKTQMDNIPDPLVVNVNGEKIFFGDISDGTPGGVFVGDGIARMDKGKEATKEKPFMWDEYAIWKYENINKEDFVGAAEEAERIMEVIRQFDMRAQGRPAIIDSEQIYKKLVMANGGGWHLSGPNIDKLPFIRYNGVLVLSPTSCSTTGAYYELQSELAFLGLGMRKSTKSMVTFHAYTGSDAGKGKVFGHERPGATGAGAGVNQHFLGNFHAIANRTPTAFTNGKEDIMGGSIYDMLVELPEEVDPDLAMAWLKRAAQDDPNALQVFESPTQGDRFAWKDVIGGKQTGSIVISAIEHLWGNVYRLRIGYDNEMGFSHENAILHDTLAQAAVRQQDTGKRMKVIAPQGIIAQRQNKFLELLSSRMQLKDLPKKDIKGKVFAVRLDWNVPVKEGQVTEPARIKESLETLQYILNNGGIPVIIAHLGQPKEKSADLSLAPCVKKAQELMPQAEFIFDTNALTMEDIAGQLNGLKAQGQGARPKVFVLENVRFNPEETAKDKEIMRVFGKKLFAGADIYVSDAFSVAHRDQGSMTGMPLTLTRVGGFLMQKEMDALVKFLGDVDVVAMGGAKVVTKIQVMNALLESAQLTDLLVGGAMANAFFVAKGVNVKDSIGKDAEDVAIAKKLLSGPNAGKLQIPVDVVAAKEVAQGAESKVFDVAKLISQEESIPDGWKIVDIGPKTVANYRQAILGSKVSFNNGAMGVFEQGFSDGTKGLYQAMADTTGYAGLGGGDTIAGLTKLGFSIDQFGYVFLAGGATLEALELKTLPGIAALSPKISSTIVIQADNGEEAVQKLRTEYGMDEDRISALLPDGRVQAYSVSINLLRDADVKVPLRQTVQGAQLYFGWPAGAKPSEIYAWDEYGNGLFLRLNAEKTAYESYQGYGKYASPAVETPKAESVVVQPMVEQPQAEKSVVQQPKVVTITQDMDNITVLKAIQDAWTPKADLGYKAEVSPERVSISDKELGTLTLIKESGLWKIFTISPKVRTVVDLEVTLPAYQKADVVHAKTTTAEKTEKISSDVIKADEMFKGLAAFSFPELSDEEFKMTVEAAKEFVRQHVVGPVEGKEYYKDWDEEGSYKDAKGNIVVPETFKKALTALYQDYAFMAMAVPADVEGGMGFDLRYAYAYIAEIAKYSPALAGIAAVDLSVAAIIQKYGTKEQKNKILTKMAKGELHGAMVITEPNAGSDAGAIRLLAQGMIEDKVNGDRKALDNETPDYYEFSGPNKCFISSLGEAGVYVVLAMTKDADKTKGTPKETAVFVVDADTDNVRIGALEHKVGQRAWATGELWFDNAKVWAENLLGTKGKGLKQTLAMLDDGRNTIAALGLGILMGAYENFIEYSNQRKQFGKAISQFEATKDKREDIELAKAAAELLLGLTAFIKDDKISDEKAKEDMKILVASLVKTYIGEQALEAANKDIQVHGGNGYSVEYPGQRFWRDARILTIYEGTSEIQRLTMLRELMKLFKGEKSDFSSADVYTGAVEQYLSAELSKADASKELVDLHRKIHTYETGFLREINAIIEKVDAAKANKQSLDLGRFEESMSNVLTYLTIARLFLFAAVRLSDGTTGYPLSVRSQADRYQEYARRVLDENLPGAWRKQQAQKKRVAGEQAKGPSKASSDVIANSFSAGLSIADIYKLLEPAGVEQILAWKDDIYTGSRGTLLTRTSEPVDPQYNWLRVSFKGMPDETYERIGDKFYRKSHASSMVEAKADTVRSLLDNLEDIMTVTAEGVTVDPAKMTKKNIFYLADEARFGETAEIREVAQRLLREAGNAMGIKEASIHDFYMARKNGKWSNMTIPAYNLRTGPTLNAMIQIFTAAVDQKVGALELELAASEQRYSGQSAAEYVAMAYAAAMAAGYRGLIFLQGDHYQVAKKADPAAQQAEVVKIEKKIREAMLAGKLNIDVDPSTLVREEVLERILAFERQMTTKYILGRSKVDQDFAKTIEAAGGIKEKADDESEAMWSLRRKLVDDIEVVGQYFLATLEKDLETQTRAQGLKNYIDSLSPEELNYLKTYGNTFADAKDIRDLYNEMHTDTIEVTEHFIQYIRNLEKELGLKTPVSIGVEERHIDNAKHKKYPSTVLGSISIMSPLMAWCAKNNFAQPSKLALQTGAMHGLGGKVDWGIFERHQLAAKAIGVGVFVQHGTSTLPQDQFKNMPRVGSGEAHLATEYQKIAFEVIAREVPKLRVAMAGFMGALINPEWSEDMIGADIVAKIKAAGLWEKREDYKKKFGEKWDAAIKDLGVQGQELDQIYIGIIADADSLGKHKGKLKDLNKELSLPFKREIAELPDAVQKKVDEALYKEFKRIHEELKVVNTRDLVEKIIPTDKVEVVLPKRPQALVDALVSSGVTLATVQATLGNIVEEVKAGTPNGRFANPYTVEFLRSETGDRDQDVIASYNYDAFKMLKSLPVDLSKVRFIRLMFQPNTEYNGVVVLRLEPASASLEFAYARSSTSDEAQSDLEAIARSAILNAAMVDFSADKKFYVSEFVEGLENAMNTDKIAVSFDGVRYEKDDVKRLSLQLGLNDYVTVVIDENADMNTLIMLRRTAAGISVSASEVLYRKDGSGPYSPSPDYGVRGAAFQVITQMAKASSIVTAPGGIDLGAASSTLQIRRDGDGIPLPVGQQPIGAMNIEGFSFIIMGITTVPNIFTLSGIPEPTDGEAMVLTMAKAQTNASAAEPRKPFEAKELEEAVAR